MIAQELEVSLHMAFMDARQKRHELITVEHLLLAMIDNPTAADVMRACGAKLEILRGELNQYIEEHTPTVNGEEEVTKRVLNPLLIFVDRGESYLIADDVLTGVDEKIFRIDRLIECLTTEITFEPRTVEFKEWKFRGKVEPAVLYVAAGNDWLLDRIAIKSHVINEDGSMFLWVDVASLPWLARLLLRCGPT